MLFKQGFAIPVRLLVSFLLSQNHGFCVDTTMYQKSCLVR